MFLLCVLCLFTTAKASENTIFYCKTYSDDTISVIEKEKKLELTINNKSYISNETHEEIKKNYIRDTKKTPSYRMIIFNSGNNKFVVGTSKDIASQEEPDSKLLTFFENTNNSPIYLCIFGEEMNNFDEWKNKK